jgi:hypothetical protein
MHVEMPPVRIRELGEGEGEPSSADIRERVR